MNSTIIIQVILNGLMLGLIYALNAWGLSLIWGVMKIINFAHGNFFMLAMYMSFWIYTLFGIDPLYNLPIIFFLFFILGVLFYKLVIKRTLKSPLPISQVLATFAAGLVIMASAIFLWTSNYKVIKGNILQGSYRVGEIFIGVPEFYTSIISVLCMILLLLFLNKTKIGRAIKATSMNQDAAQLVGINIEHMFQIVVGLGIALVGIAGSLVSNFYYIHPESGLIFALLSYVVVAIGGLGYLPGALYGGLILGMVTSVSGLFLPSYKYAIAYLVYFIVVYFKPKGLKG